MSVWDKPCLFLANDQEKNLDLSSGKKTFHILYVKCATNSPVTIVAEYY